jgi:hypothetical protein
MNNNCGGGVFYLTEDSLKVKNSYSQGGGGRTRDTRDCPGQVQFR